MKPNFAHVFPKKNISKYRVTQPSYLLQYKELSLECVWQCEAKNKSMHENLYSTIKGHLQDVKQYMCKSQNSLTFYLRIYLNFKMEINLEQICINYE